MEYGCAYSFVGAPTTAETTAAAAHLVVTTYIFFIILLVFVPGTFLRVLITSIVLVQLSQERVGREKKNTEQDQLAVVQ